MKIAGPERYKLSFDSNSFTAECEQGTSKFSKNATSRKPKLYIASVNGKPIYVGITKQPIRNRLRLGWNAKGLNGYQGYAWRHQFTNANLDIWSHENAPDEKPSLDIETVEAEVVFLIRSAGQWPLCQTEIHFHPSTSMHRDLAASIFAHYKFQG